MTHAINYRLVKSIDEQLSCEVHINGQLAVTLRNEDGYQIDPAPHFADKSVNSEDLQSAIEGAMRKLENAGA